MLNKVILLGRLTKDPEIRYMQTQTGEPFATGKYTLAVNRDFKRNGEPEADFIPCAVTGRRAEFAEKFLTKGKLIGVVGRLQIRTWDDQNGQRRWITEVVVDEHHFAESKSSSEANRSSMSQAAEQSYQSYQSYNQNANKSNPVAPSGPEGFFDIAQAIEGDDDLPF